MKNENESLRKAIAKLKSSKLEETKRLELQKLQEKEKNSNETIQP